MSETTKPENVYGTGEEAPKPCPICGVRKGHFVCSHSPVIRSRDNLLRLLTKINDAWVSGSPEFKDEIERAIKPDEQ